MRLIIEAKFGDDPKDLRKNTLACLFSVHDTLSLSGHEQVCLMRLRFERYFSDTSAIREIFQSLH